MGNYAWLTDIHIDHLKSDQAIVEFADRCSDTSYDGYFITGDISNSYKLIEHLSILEAAWQKQIFFVNGNHDFWGSTIGSVRKRLTDLMNLSPYLKYMSVLNYVPLGGETALIGHDGWYDAQNGLARESPFVMNDWFEIGDFVEATRGAQRSADINKQIIIETAQKLASDSVIHVHRCIKEAVRYHNNIIILTHIPPWTESHVHNGLPGTDMTTPWYTSKIMGQLLEAAADKYKNVNFTVLAGHTHGHSRTTIRNNLKCMVGHADYVNPKVQEVISF